MLAPLLNTNDINQRLNAVEDMITNQHETDVLRARLSKLPDLEKLLAKIFTYSIKHSVKAVYFEDVNLAKMKDFKTLLNVFRDFDETIESFQKLANSITSSRLQLLVTKECDGGLVPEKIKEALEEFEGLILWKTVAGPTKLEVPEPQPGIDEEFDDANRQVNVIKDDLEEYCEKMRKQYHERKINFSHAK